MLVFNLLDYILICFFMNEILCCKAKKNQKKDYGNNQSKV